MALSIYDRAGGFTTVRKVVSDFYDRVLDSPVLRHHFEHVNMPRLIDHQTRFVSFLLGGPASFSDDHIQRVHARLGIGLDDFDEMVSLLTETLEDHDFTTEDVATVRKELERRESLIVTIR